MLRQKLLHYASFQQRSVPLNALVEFGRKVTPVTLLQGSQFLREELPVRLARRVIELENLPQGLHHTAAVKQISSWYSQSFEDLAALPERQFYDPKLYTTVSSSGHSTAAATERYNVIKISEMNENFVNVLDRIKRRHDPVVMEMAKGMIQLKERLGQQKISPEVHSFFDRFHMSRIGKRLLIGQHTALVRHPNRPDWVGAICTKTNISEVVAEAAMNSQDICRRYYGMDSVPKVDVVCNPALTFTYIPSHLHHMLFELLKNALRAIVENAGVNSERFPAVRVIVAEGNEDVTIKVSDEGGGISRSVVDKVWEYGFSTALPPDYEDDSRGDFQAPLAGFGYGLPLIRLYAKYFGGELKLISMEGFGTDVYLHLCRLSNIQEPLF